jgi:Protein of unknown function (DUF4058)
MPLLDHFHEPIYPTNGWQTFQMLWSVTLFEQLTRLLPPPRFLTQLDVSLGTRVEADVAEYEMGPPDEAGTNGAPGSVAVQAWAPPRAMQTVGIVFPDEIEVQVYDLRDGKRLVAAIELVSPRNKDRTDARRAFAAKCVASLQRGIGLIVVDIVSNRRANLHNETLALLGQDAAAMPEEVELYAAAYHPAHRDGANQLDLWPVPLAIGQPLPLLPLALRGLFCVPVDLEATYSEARSRASL